MLLRHHDEVNAARTLCQGPARRKHDGSESGTRSAEKGNSSCPGSVAATRSRSSTCSAGLRTTDRLITTSFVSKPHPYSGEVGGTRLSPASATSYTPQRQQLPDPKQTIEPQQHRNTRTEEVCRHSCTAITTVNSHVRWFQFGKGTQALQ